MSKKSEKSPYIPAISKMTQSVIDTLEKKGYKKTIESIKSDIIENGESFTIETLLSNIEGKISIIGKGKLNELDKEQFIALGKEIRDIVREIVSVHKHIKDDCFKEMAQYDFGSWIKSAFRKYAVEIFTTNYDFML